MKHTTARIGKRIHVIMHSGKAFEDKLMENKSLHYEFERVGHVSKRDIRSFSIAKKKKEELALEGISIAKKKKKS